jgi:hypothetical protein
MEQENHNRAMQATGASWNQPGQSAVFKGYLCPSDPSNNAGLSQQAGGWAAISYSRNYQMFDTGQRTMSGQNCTVAQYNVGNIPDGTSNTVAVTERFSGMPAYGWSSLWTHYQQEGRNWGYSQWAPVYFYNGWCAGTNCQQSAGPQGNSNYTTAHPYYPSSAHSGTVQTLLMDGSVRGVSSGVSGNTWYQANMPADGSVLGSDW